MNASSQKVLKLASVSAKPASSMPASPSRAPLVPTRTEPLLHALRSIERWLPQARYQLMRVGPTGLTGAGAILVALIAVVFVALPARRAELALSGQLAHAPTALGIPVPKSLSEQLLVSLPDRNQVPGVLAHILTEAAGAGVSLDKGHYDFRPPQPGSLARYGLEFPIKGPYSNVRQFIDHTLTDIPSVALDKLRFERRTIGDPAISATVAFTVYVRGD